MRDGQVSQSISWLVGSPLADVAALARRSFPILHSVLFALWLSSIFRCDGLSAPRAFPFPSHSLVCRWEDAVCHLGRFIP